MTRFRVHFDDGSTVDVDADSANAARKVAWLKRTESAQSINKVKVLKEEQA